MTTEQPETISFKRFSNSVLPWIVLGAALALYLVTMNHWVTFSSLSLVAKVSGWDWQKPIAAPLYYLLTLPIRWLPEAWHAIALNVLSVVCASLTLALLARSVALLPQDRTKEQRMREHDEFSLLSIRWAWIPVVLAVLLCGFQLTYWENATIASVETLDLLVFAYVIRCLLEYRLTENERWIYKAAFVYGLGMANSWAMVGYLPLFVGAMIWIRGFSFFNARFIGRVVIFGCLGLLLYLLLPIVGAISNSGFSFWEILKANLSHQKNLTLGNPFLGGLKYDFLTMALTSLVPLVLVGARWTADYADISPVGSTLTNWMFRLLHLTLLVFCVWVFFDYKFSPRVLSHGMFPFLTLYYLSALSAGYLCGYILLVFGHDGERRWGKTGSSFRSVNRAIAALVGTAALVTPLWLFYRTLPAIKEGNGPSGKMFARRMAKNLPGNAVVLSDNPLRLYLMQALEAVEGESAHRVYLATASLPSPRYHDFLRRRYSSDQNAFIHASSMDDTIDSLHLLGFLEQLRQTHPIYYLHSSFGYYFERFYPRQHGLVFELKPFPDGEFAPPKLEDQEIDENENFWREVPAAEFKRLMNRADTVQEAALLCSFYSSALNSWGVELQRNNHMKIAEDKFYEAWTLDPNNVIAQINGRYNVNVQKGEVTPLQSDDALIKQLNALGGLIRAISYFGPVDEPSACLVLAEVLKKGANLRQSAQAYARVTEMVPQDLGCRINFVQVLVDLHLADRATEELLKIKTGNKDQLAFYELELLNLESQILLLKNDFAAAENLMMEGLEQNLRNESWQRLVFQFYLNAAETAKSRQPAVVEDRYKKAIGVLDQLIELNPSPAYLLNKAVLLSQIGKRDLAIKVLDHLLNLEPANVSALMNRAIFKLQEGQFDAAKADYLALEKLKPAEIQKVYYGLAQVAEGTKDTAGAIKNYKAYIEVADPDTPEFLQVKTRLNELQSGKKS